MLILPAIMNQKPAGGSANGLLTLIESYWKFEEVSGTRFDAHGSYDLVDNNTVTRTTGISANAAEFATANSEYLSIAEVSSPLNLSGGNQSFTYSAWIKPGTLPATADVLRVDPAAFRQTNDGKLRFFKNGATSGWVSADTATGLITINTWHHVVCVHSAGNYVKVFTNGVLRAYSTHAVVSENFGDPGDTSNLLIGWTGGTGYFDGIIDEAAIWHRALSDGGVTTIGNSATGDIATLYNSGAGTFYDDFD